MEMRKDEVEEIVRLKSGKKPTTSSTKFFKRLEETIQLGKNKRQTSINDASRRTQEQGQFNTLHKNKIIFDFMYYPLSRLDARRYWEDCQSKKVIQRGIKLVGYIYNHSMALNTMRKFTNKSELVRHGVTRFATTFLTLQRLHKQKANLRRMFTSNEWLESRAVKDSKGKKATDIIHSKNRSRLKHQKLQDLIMLNITKLFMNAIALKDIDDSNEWIVGELDGEGEDAEDELVFDDDVLTWGNVASATGVVKPLKYTRRQT
ncbi:hypothetical protein CR513_07115, partial [Mucuna pruriens]